MGVGVERRSGGFDFEIDWFGFGFGAGVCLRDRVGFEGLRRGHFGFGSLRHGKGVAATIDLVGGVEVVEFWPDLD